MIDNIKTGCADTTPETLVRYNGGFYYNYNITQVESETRKTQFQFNYVWVDEINKEKLVEARIRTQYSLNDELKMARIDHASDAWIAFNTFIENVVAEVEGALE